MGTTIKYAKRILGMMLTAMLMACLGFASAIQTSAAAAGDHLKLATELSFVEILLIVIIVILVIALIAGGIIFFVVLNKKKETPGQQNVPMSNYPVQQPMQQQNPPYAAPQPYQSPQPQAPMNNPAPMPMQNNGFNNPVVNNPRTGNLRTNNPRTFNPITNEGTGDAAILGTGTAGFILLRKNGGDKVCINKAEFIIGKEQAKVDYCINNNNSISRKHAKISVRAGKCYISDLGSTNSTYINGTKLNPNQEVALIPGDKVKFSNEEFEFIG